MRIQYCQAILIHALNKVYIYSNMSEHLMREYNHKTIESKWQKIWEKNNLYKTSEDLSKPKSYVLDMFPYPSGEGLHAGHVRVYTASDIYARYKRMKGFRVLHPTGWDAFGLPAEQFAIKNKIHPRIAVDKNVKEFRRQMKMLGLSYDWDREIDTTDPSYYKWTQWIFLKLFEKGLAYESYEPIIWCPSCQTGLANEDLEGNQCERCSTVVEKRPMRQWVLKITDYADRLVEDLDLLSHWPVAFREAEKNWIGRSSGSIISFELVAGSFKDESDSNLKPKSEKLEASFDVFTTRADTLFGATYAVLSPEHKLLEQLRPNITNWDEVVAYQKLASEKTEIERTSEGKEKTGVNLGGIKAINPANKEEIPIYISDYVLAHYGTGAIMAVPAHDTRDHEFAKKFDLPIVGVISPENWTVGRASELENIYKHSSILEDAPILNSGLLVNSGRFNDMPSEQAKKEVTQFVGGQFKTTYKLRDWVFSRQRYWGEPIPIIHCEKCGAVPVPEKDLPVLLPDVRSYEPTGTGESPLAGMSEWVDTPCPKCGGAGERETNTMPQWAGSSWYYFRFIDPQNRSELVGSEKERGWMPVDMYVGGAEHATRHLIYARFWHKFLFDMGITKTIEPFVRLESVGLILGEGGTKMSKRLGNVVNPDGIVNTYGSDTLRMYMMFIGPFSQAASWDTRNIIGPRRFLERVWRLTKKVGDSLVSQKIDKIINQSIKKIGEDIEQFKFNTAISQLMILLSELELEEKIPKTIFESLLKILSPFAPHISEELWNEMKNVGSIHDEAWPKHDDSKLEGSEYKIIIQINGKVRGSFSIPAFTNEDEVKSMALDQKQTVKWLDGKVPKKLIYVPGKLISIVV